MGGMNSNFWKIDGASVTPASTWDIEVPDGKSMVSGTVPATPVLSNEIYTDSGLEIWTDVNTLTNFTDEDFGEEGVGTSLDREDTEIHGGTYSVKLTTGNDGGANPTAIYFYQTEAIAGETFKLDFWCKNGTGKPRLMISNGAPGAGTEAYDFVAGAWANLGGWPTADMILETNAVAYTQVTLDNLPSPNNGTVTVIYLSPSADTETCYFDDVSIKSYDRDAITIFDNVSGLDEDDLNESDYIFKYRSTDGIPKLWLALNADEEFVTDMEKFDFASAGIHTEVFAVTTEPDAALNQFSGVSYLGRTATGAVDLKTTGAVATTAVIPTGYRLINAFATVVTETADTLSGNGVLTAGANSAEYNNIGIELNYSATAGKQKSVSSANEMGLGSAGTVYVNLTQPDAGTSGTATVYIFGTLVATA